MATTSASEVVAEQDPQRHGVPGTFDGDSGRDRPASHAGQATPLSSSLSTEHKGQVQMKRQRRHSLSLLVGWHSKDCPYFAEIYHFLTLISNFIANL